MRSLVEIGPIVLELFKLGNVFSPFQGVTAGDQKSSLKFSAQVSYKKKLRDCNGFSLRMLVVVIILSSIFLISTHTVIYGLLH